MSAARIPWYRRWLPGLSRNSAKAPGKDRVNEEIAALMTPLSHDLRSAPGTILSLCEAGPAWEEAKWRDEVARQARRGLDSADRMLALLRLSLPDSLEKVPLALVALLDEALDDMSERTGRRVDMQTSGEEVLEVTGDFVLLRHVFTELLALAAGTAADDSAISLSCRPAQDSALCCILVPGADPGDRGFREWFSQGQYSTASAAVPLALAALILRHHGGDLQVLESAGDALELRARLPLAASRG